MSLDPFRDVPDPALYVPRDASDLALARLAACVREPRRPCALLAPPGFGKTLLLHSLARLLPERACVYVPNPTLPPDGLCAWTLDRLEAPVWDDALEVFGAYAEHLDRQGRFLAWLIDDAHGLDGESAGWLRRMQETHAGLRLVCAALSDLPAELGELERIDCLARPMTLEETRRYLERRAERGGTRQPWAPGERALDAIYESSGGVPRAVCTRAGALLGQPRRWTSLQPLV